MEKINFKSLGLNEKNIGIFEEQFNSFKKNAKKKISDENVVRCNFSIDKKKLVKGSEIKFLYKGDVLVGKVKTEPKTPNKNLSVICEQIKTKSANKYVSKSNFLSVVSHERVLKPILIKRVK